MDAAWRFEDFRPGTEIACREMRVPAESEDSLARAFPELDRDDLSTELTIAMLMRAYTALVAPRPPGNIHAEQDMRLFGTIDRAVPYIARAICLETERKADRNWIQFQLDLTQNGVPVVEARMRFAWAT